ncbi:ATP-binding protein [Pedobacter ginsenosidimutans]|uniref:DNA 3'-5' helicase n=1 Tax=Pedobacter ginsenosidimutans TaxID=687842 RepID=A0A0T5VMA2_9SPHI|nr:RecQ family ATP-dependent DNA helicase [Pedobacter ginsenosidimutans]KRT15004.1 ATP-binding protein [Pedobacter ginsenosidimutans]
MKSIAFVDTEINPDTLKILDIGGVKNDGTSIHSNSTESISLFLNNTEFICGHNIIYHDIPHLKKSITGLDNLQVIDTLYLSPLLFPNKPYHALLKDDKLQVEELNNPLNDAIKTKDLFYDEVATFDRLDSQQKQIFHTLLQDKKEFSAFFKFINFQAERIEIASIIRGGFQSKICEHADLDKIVQQDPVELAYCLSIINCQNRDSITPRWVLKNYPKVERIMAELTNKPCLTGCEYCNTALDIRKGLKKYFGFDSYRLYADEPLQEKSVQAAIDNKSILAVFPTGGGKSITFQVPALMAGANAKGLTVIISPLQSLMKDQVDNLEKIGITEAVTINGLLDPIERGKSFERVEDGSASMLYISPESLRSKSIERLLLGRKIIRFVIDEAHCFSSWGQDFRVDYLYIGDFIKLLQEKKNLEDGIPVSCFTATAKQNVIEDIRNYFKNKLSLDLEVFSSKASRTNLSYNVFEKNDEEEKYNALRDLIEEKLCPTIVYVSRRGRAVKLANRLLQDGFSVAFYHAGMESSEKTKSQNEFIAGQTDIMVATSAFGMGVDKKDVGMVVHYDISDSLENYVQEAGRAGRDEKLSAVCYVLFNEEDLSKHFILLNQTKLSIKEIQQIWKAVKDITRFRLNVSNSALEIARKAGWDDSVNEMETRVTTAIAALEEAGYLKRGQNMPRVFANSILAKTAQEAIDKINNSFRFDEKQKEKAIRIIKKLLSSKSRKLASDDGGEARVDYISDHLGIVKEDVIHIINLLREEKILADTMDLTAFIKKNENRNRSLSIVETFRKIENFLLPVFKEQKRTINLKELNEEAESLGFSDFTPNKIKTIINFWTIKNWIKRQNHSASKNHITVITTPLLGSLTGNLNKRHELARFIVEYLYDKSNSSKENAEKDEVLVEFSVHGLKDAFHNRTSLFQLTVTIDDVEDTLFYLSRIEAIKIEGGFMVIYNRLTIDRLENDNKRRYKAEDYEKLSQFYENKIQQIHIVGEYAKKMIENYNLALAFVNDYFQLNYSSFVNKYFDSNRQNEIKRNITPAKYRQLFGSLSQSQSQIIGDKENRYIVVAAGPGSGKTKVLVHKLASLLLMEDVKHEQLLMLTFSRAAATEFKKRLLALIGNAAGFVEIKTFHSFCFDLLGKVGSLEKADAILKNTIAKIKSNEVEISKITKAVLVIDEAQDMNADEFELINTLMEQNEEMRVIAVGDDDQNIYEFRNADSKYLEEFINKKDAVKYELIDNYRSKRNLVSFSNQFITKVSHRLKITPIIPIRRDNGNIKIIHHKSGNLISPLVDNILQTGLTGTTCVLTKTNEEAAMVVGSLLKYKVPAQLIQTNDSFNLYNLAEIRFFLTKLVTNDEVYTYSDEVWANAYRELSYKFKKSSKFKICDHLIRDFEAVNPKIKYKSDFDVFIKESKIEDFFSDNSETIMVSTIHKAKGKEYDNVFLLLKDFDMSKDSTKRQLYVGMTRAKNNLSVHLNGNYLDQIEVENLERIEDNNVYPELEEIVCNLTHTDIWLDYTANKQNLISPLISGEVLIVDGDECKNLNGQSVLKFSKKFISEIESQSKKGYDLKGAKVNFVLYWLKEGATEEIKIILPEVLFVKRKSN